MFINNGADDDRVAFWLLNGLRETSRLKRASERDG